MTPFLMGVAIMLSIFLSSALEALRQGIHLYGPTITAMVALLGVIILCGVSILLVTKSWPGKAKK